MNEQGLNSLTKRECVSKMFGKRGLNALVVTGTKLKRKGEFKICKVIRRIAGIRTRRAREGAGIFMCTDWRLKVNGLGGATSRLIYVKLEKGVDYYRILGSYGPGVKATREERKAAWFEVIEVKAGCESDELVHLMGDMNSHVGDVKISAVGGDFWAENVNENRECWRCVYRTNGRSAKPFFRKKNDK